MNPRWIEQASWRMGEVYAAVTDRILINLASHFKYIAEGAEPGGAWDYQIRKLAELGQVTRETEAIILESMKGADPALAELLEETIRESLEKVEPDLRKAAEKGLLFDRRPVPPKTAPNMTRAFKAFYKQSADRLNLVNTVMLESTQQAYRATVADIALRMERTQGILNVASGEVVTGVSSLNQAMRQAVQKMVDNGITGYIDNGNHHWSPEAYVTMDIRTTLANTAREAVTEQMHEYGCDLFSVSWHNGARPLCYPWQGKVISESGRTGEVEDLDGNKVIVYALDETSYGEPAGLFGVNCGHYKIPFIPGFSKARQPQQDEEQNDKEYAESQQQRQLERNLRAEKRDLEVLKAQGASDEEMKAQRERVAKARNDLDAFCDETGRARRSGRERTPIDAKWPAQNGQVRRFNGQYVNTDQPLHVTPVAQETPTVAPQTAPVAKTPVTINSAETFDQLSQAVSDAYGATISDDVKNLEFSKVKRALTGVESITNEFPDVGKNFERVITSNTGVMSCGGEKLTFNPDYYGSGSKLQDSIDRCVKSGWWPKGTSVESIGAHEAAHGIEWFLDMNSPDFQTYYQRVNAWNKCTVAKGIVSKACDNVKKTPFGKGKKNAELIKGISGYATKNPSETLAESFADVYSNGENANPLSIEIRRLTRELYIKFGGKVNGN